MERRNTGLVLIAAGVLLAALGLFADPIGIGGVDTFGWKQTAAVVAGLVLAVAGIALLGWLSEGGPEDDRGEPPPPSEPA